MKSKTIIRSYQLKSSKTIEKGKVKIAYLTDMHNCVVGEDEKKLFKLLEICAPDLVMVGGDVILGKPGADLGPGVRFMERLSQRYMVIYANGNHEQRISLHQETYGDMGADYENAIAWTKAIRLLNRKIELTVKGIPFTVYGLNAGEDFYEKGFRKKDMAGELERIFGHPDQNRYTVLLAHNPRYAEDYMNWGADLTLSGHYHGGVILLGKRTGVVTPDFHIFSGLCCGIRSHGNANMIVSAGLGEHTVPVRIRNPRELTVVEIEYS